MPHAFAQFPLPPAPSFTINSPLVGMVACRIAGGIQRRVGNLIAPEGEGCLVFPALQREGCCVLQYSSIGAADWRSASKERRRRAEMRQIADTGVSPAFYPLSASTRRVDEIRYSSIR
mmetsp:Transcript_9309/g.20209  ORF Transcript_9309/g.20209 Transcript_9309/m.20209 type:complete len:118 (+) Transcript_9309:233-586(+)